MLRITTILDAAPAPGATLEQLEIPLAQRERSRFCATLRSGVEVAVVLERGKLLRGGTFLRADDGRVVEVIAAEEPLLRVTASDCTDLIRAAYHLGNRHVRLELAPDFLHMEPDPVLGAMLEHLGFTVREVQAPFEPEGGIYGYAQVASDHHHGHMHGEGAGHHHEHSHDTPHGRVAGQRPRLVAVASSTPATPTDAD